MTFDGNVSLGDGYFYKDSWSGTFKTDVTYTTGVKLFTSPMMSWLSAFPVGMSWYGKPEVPCHILAGSEFDSDGIATRAGNPGRIL